MPKINFGNWMFRFRTRKRFYGRVMPEPVADRFARLFPLSPGHPQYKPEIIAFVRELRDSITVLMQPGPRRRALSRKAAIRALWLDIFNRFRVLGITNISDIIDQLITDIISP